MTNDKKSLGKMIKQFRGTADFTVRQLGVMSGVSASHLGRVERGERFPSAHILRKIAKPLGLSESELFTFAGYLSPQPSGMLESSSNAQLDPYVARVLSREPVEVQHTVLAICFLLKYITKGIVQEILGAEQGRSWAQAAYLDIPDKHKGGFHKQGEKGAIKTRDCELLATCPFFNDRIQNTFEMAEIYKEQYCKGNYPWCGRYMVVKSLEREFERTSSADLFRNQKIRTNEINAK